MGKTQSRSTLSACRTLIHARHGGHGSSSGSGNGSGNSNSSDSKPPNITAPSKKPSKYFYSRSSGAGGSEGNRFPGDAGRPFSELHFFSAGRTFDSYPLKTAASSPLNPGNNPNNNHNPNEVSHLTPQAIREYLDKYVIGQEHAKKVIAVSVFNHYCRLRAARAARRQSMLQLDSSAPVSTDEGDDLIVPEKSNILLIGPSGSGKTLLARTISRLLRVPFAMGDATGLTEAGYVGEDVDSILYRLLEVSDFSLERAQAGIVFLDEVDKIAKVAAGPKGTPSSGGGRDVGGEGVQHALLKMLEGTTVQVADRRRTGGRDYIPLDTSNLLFILSGAFVGLESIVAARKAATLGSGSIGFTAATPETESTSSNSPNTNTASSAICGKWMSDLQTTDVISYGLIPEFIGRVPVLAVLEELDEKALVRTLTEPKNSLIRQYQHLFQMQGIKLSFTPDALEAIGQQAVQAKTGARGLRGILEKLLLGLMYEMPSRKDVAEIIIDGEFVKGLKSQDSVIKLK